MAPPSSEGHERSEKAPVAFLGFSGFRKDAALENFFNPARDFSLCCEAQDTATLGAPDGGCSAPPLHRRRPCCHQLAPRRRSRAGADRGRLAPAKQLFGRSPTQVDLSKDWAIYCPQRLFQKCAAQKLTSASRDRLWSQRWPVKKRQPSLRSKCWKLRSEIQSNLNKRKNPIDFDEARQSIHGDDGEPSLFVFPYSPWHNLLPRNVRTFCFSIKIMYLHNISAFHSIVPGLHFRSLSLWSRFLYPPLYLIPREFDRISIQNQSGSLEMLLQPHYAFEGRVYGRDYCHVAPPSSWSIKYKNAWIQFLTYFWGK